MTTEPITIASGVTAEATDRGVVITRKVTADTTEIICCLSWAQLESLMPVRTIQVNLKAPLP